MDERSNKRRAPADDTPPLTHEPPAAPRLQDDEEDVKQDDSLPGIGTSVDPAKVERLLRKAETILRHRTDRLLLVLERPFITDNYLGCLRTAECMGVQNVWIVVQQRGYNKTDAPEPGSKQELKEFRKRVRLSRQSAQWLDVREFSTTAQCVTALQEGGWQVWATDLSESSVNLMDSASLGALPSKLAIVMGREADGVTEEMLVAAHKRVHLPLVGFNTSLNLQVATGMVLQQLLSMCRNAQGDMSDERKAIVRRDWYTKLARSDAQKSAFLAFLDCPPPPYDDIRHME